MLNAMMSLSSAGAFFRLTMVVLGLCAIARGAHIHLKSRSARIPPKLMSDQGWCEPGVVPALVETDDKCMAHEPCGFCKFPRNPFNPKWLNTWCSCPSHLTCQYYSADHQRSLHKYTCQPPAVARNNQAEVGSNMVVLDKLRRRRR